MKSIFVILIVKVLAALGRISVKTVTFCAIHATGAITIPTPQNAHNVQKQEPVTVSAVTIIRHISKLFLPLVPRLR
jgi:hypothetical protein